MSPFLIRVLLVALMAVVTGGCGEETNPAMSLQFTNRVFVAVDLNRVPGTPAGGDFDGTWADLTRLMAHMEVGFEAGQAPAIIVYSNVRYLPAGTAYVPTRVIKLFQAALADDSARGIVVNPGVGGIETTVMTREQMKSALPRIMQHKEPLPFAVQIAGQE